MDSRYARTKNLVSRNKTVFRKFAESSEVTMGFPPKVRILAKLMLIEAHEEKSRVKY